VTSALAFLALCELLGVAALPLLAVAFARLPAAVAFAKPLGVLLVGWLAWLLGSLGAGSGIGVIAAAVLIVAAGGVLLAGRRPAAARAVAGGDGRPALLGLLRSPAFWAAEAVFLVSFAVMALVVAHAPDVWGTEKPMDMALINALAVGDGFPPRDPWLSGTDVDGYYYLGHWLAALMLAICGVEPSVGYNLALAAFFALSACAAYGLGAALAAIAARRPAPAGLALAALVLVAGNLAAGVELLRHDGPLNAYPWFQASRVVPDTINEFPAFSWLLGDLHAHVLAVPFTLVALALALQWLHAGARVLDTLLAGVLCGSLYAINAWSYPVTTGLLGLALIASPGVWRRRGALAGLLIAASLIAVLPFLLRFDAPASGLELVGRRSPLLESARQAALTAGPALWLVTTAYLALAGRAPRRTVLGAGALTVVAIAAGAGSGLRLGWVTLLLAAAALAAWQLLRPVASGSRPAPEAFAWLAAFGGITCLLLPELVFVRDAFAGGPLERMNTVFKLGYQAWLLLGAGGVAAVLAFRRVLAPPVRALWSAGAALAVLAACAFPIAGTYARTGGFAGTPRLHGLGWLAASAPGDVAGIAWLRRHADPAAIVLESAGDDYSPAGHARMSTFSGRSTVLGWAGHVLQWGEDPGRRRADVTLLYRETDAAAVRPLLESYGVDYVVVGPLERSDHGTAGEAKWDLLGARVFERAGTTIWRLDRFTPARPARAPVGPLRTGGKRVSGAAAHEQPLAHAARLAPRPAREHPLQRAGRREPSVVAHPPDAEGEAARLVACQLGLEALARGVGHEQHVGIRQRRGGRRQVEVADRLEIAEVPRPREGGSLRGVDGHRQLRAAGAPASLGEAQDAVPDSQHLLGALGGDQQLARIGPVFRVDPPRREHHVGGRRDDERETRATHARTR
jgi:YYY domain-containing protein